MKKHQKGLVPKTEFDHQRSFDLARFSSEESFGLVCLTNFDPEKSKKKKKVRKGRREERGREEEERGKAWERGEKMREKGEEKRWEKGWREGNGCGERGETKGQTVKTRGNKGKHGKTKG